MTKPKKAKAGQGTSHKTPPAGTAAPDEELLFGPIVRAFLAASKDVWNDPGVWIEERDSDDRRLLAWPRPVEGTSYEKLRAILFNSEVEFVLVVMRLCTHPATPAAQDPQDPVAPAWPRDLQDPGFQIVLRVVHRACLKGEAAIDAFKELAGADRVTGLREFKNDVKAALVDWIQRSGFRGRLRDDAFAAVGISRSAAYRRM